MNNIASAFKTATLIINPITIATFFNKTCTVIFDYLLAAASIEGRLFGPISIYFGTVEINERGMFQLYYLVWLIRMSNLSNFWPRICGKPNYLDQLFYFQDYIITTSLLVYFSDLSLVQDLSQDKFNSLPIIEKIDVCCATPSAVLNKVASKVHMHSFSHNTSYYKYGKINSKCHFNFP